MDNLHYNMSPSDTVKKLAQKEAIYQIGGEKTGACRGGTGKNHKVYIENDRVTPAITNATLCDTLTIINKDKNKRELTFGTHPEHSAYGGETEIELRKDYNKTITLNQAGNYMFHDHLDPTVSGYFIVVK
jgi:plastocyanin